MGTEKIVFQRTNWSLTLGIEGRERRLKNITFNTIFSFFVIGIIQFVIYFAFVNTPEGMPVIKSLGFIISRWFDVIGFPLLGSLLINRIMKQNIIDCHSYFVAIIVWIAFLIILVIIGHYLIITASLFIIFSIVYSYSKSHDFRRFAEVFLLLGFLFIGFPIGFFQSSVIFLILFFISRKIICPNLMKEVRMADENELESLKKEVKKRSDLEEIEYKGHLSRGYRPA